MSWELNSDRPIYAQLLEILKCRIVSGYYQPGEKLLPVRELAAEAKVNPNTMQKALQELEREELVFAVRTTGRYITEDLELIQSIKKEVAVSHLATFYEEMQAIGFSKDEMVHLLSDYEEEKQ